jgi:myo-inositol-1(or 4)-monophosphatase
MSTHTLSEVELKSLLEFSISLAREAGQLILKGSDAILSASAGGGSVEEKKNSVDLVTEYDRQVEDLVKGRIRVRYPDYGL